MSDVCLVVKPFRAGIVKVLGVVQRDIGVSKLGDPSRRDILICTVDLADMAS